jgi:hypothetical protein
MGERSDRRKWTKNLIKLNEKGWYTLDGKLFMAVGYVRAKIAEYLNDPTKLKEFLEKVKRSKIFVSEESDRDSAIALLESHGLNPTVNKFIMLGK